MQATSDAGPPVDQNARFHVSGGERVADGEREQVDRLADGVGAERQVGAEACEEEQGGEPDPGSAGAQQSKNETR